MGAEGQPYSAANTSIVPAGGALPEAAILAGQLAPSSIARYGQDVSLYVAWASGAGLAPLVPATLARYRAALAQQTRLAPATINRRLSAVKAVVRAGAEQGYVPAEVAAQFGLVRGVAAKALKGRGRQNARTKITPAQMRLLCNCPTESTPAGLRDRALLALLASSGVRIAEACGVRREDLVERDGGYFVRVVGKNKVEPREAPLSAEAHERIGMWLAARRAIAPDLYGNVPYIFTSQAGRGGRWTERALSPAAGWALVKKYAELCGLAHVHPHDFRRFVGTQLAARDIRLAQKALGHQSLDVTARHYVLDELAPNATEGLY